MASGGNQVAEAERVRRFHRRCRVADCQQIYAHLEVGDWWRLDVPEAGAGADYGFLVDDEVKCYPDPRSQWQPNGVHGLSRVYDQRQFVWTDAGFQAPPLASGIVYELHLGTFTPEGTYAAAQGRRIIAWRNGFTLLK